MPRQFSEFETLAACPVCGAPGPFEPFEEHIARCRHCRTLFDNPRPTQREVAVSYNEGATYAGWNREGRDWQRMWEQRLRLVGSNPPPGTRLLDVGAGDGSFLDLARRHGYDVLGTEFSEEGARRAREVGLEILLGQLCDIDFGGRRFDVVTLWHVLEHVPNPGQVLTRVFELLQPGGRLVVAVPNEDNALMNHRLGRRRWLPKEGRFPKPQWGTEIHLTHFQKPTLTAALRQAGFEVIRTGIDDINSWTSLRRRLVLVLQTSLDRVVGWNFGIAMYAVGRKPPAAA
jgi:2-polyprenyl-3-methyl-5-hydroxy-6-metoxy-1,4-benzoquinol methylase